MTRQAKRTLIITVGIGLLVLAFVVWIVVASFRSAPSQPIPASALPSDTSMGAIDLQVRDLDLMTDYYADAVGLTVLDNSAAGVTLGLDDPLLTLIPLTGSAAHANGFVTPTEAGLYHSAILYPDEASLANTLLNIATLAPESFQGSSDHAVSLAFYFVDPEGNGLELYVDRPEESWVWVDGEVQMGSAALDPNAFMRDHLGAEPAPSWLSQDGACAP